MRDANEGDSGVKKSAFPVWLQFPPIGVCSKKIKTQTREACAWPLHHKEAVVSELVIDASECGSLGQQSSLRRGAQVCEHWRTGTNWTQLRHTVFGWLEVTRDALALALAEAEAEAEADDTRGTGRSDAAVEATQVSAAAILVAAEAAVVHQKATLAVLEQRLREEHGAEVQVLQSQVRQKVYRMRYDTA
ncbi:hypothetical protein Vretifemale_13390 [Volvox reticuliferus]|uniref:Uncharacterized protein n=1 Tax=Volvox reticuliferus TaxID=1737510 RepID=A0A8J4FUH5_9CHLO|nr:hypothetical protein Vretifemale_13390 [Volvox reticuliferus]